MTTWDRNRSAARKFAREVDTDRTYYTVAECEQPWGNELMYRAWEFKPSRLWGATSGHLSAEGVVLGFGPITDVEPRGIRDMFAPPQRLFDPNADNGRGLRAYEKARKEVLKALRIPAGTRR